MLVQAVDLTWERRPVSGRTQYQRALVACRESRFVLPSREVGKIWHRAHNGHAAHRAVEKIINPQPQGASGLGTCRAGDARLAGLEPATGCLEGSCSIQLSYRRPEHIVHGVGHMPETMRTRVCR